MERILVGVDDSAPSLKAVDFGADLASKYNAELILLRVVGDCAPEFGPAVEEYARSEHIPVAAAEFALTVADNVLDNARMLAGRRSRGVPRGSWPSHLSATRPSRSLRQPATAKPI